VFAPPSSLTAACVDQIREVFAVLGVGGQAAEEQVGGLRARLAQVPDPRRPQGRRHCLSSLLLIVLCALAADKDGYTHMEAWARDAPPRVLSALGVRFDALTGGHVVPDESTLRDVMARIDPAALAAAQADYLADLAEGRAAARADAPDEREARRAARTGSPSTPLSAVAGDGKRLAGAVLPGDRRVHLTSLVTHAGGVTVAQRPTSGKGGEAAAARVLIAAADLAGSVVTFDALHTCAATAQAVIEAKAWWMFCVKGNTPTLLEHVTALLTGPNDDYAAAGRFLQAHNRGHGRIEYRSIRTADIPDGTDLGLPGAAQVFRILRRTKDLHTEHGWLRKEHVWGATALPATLAGPADLAVYARGHWSVENKSHYVRDVTFGEDHSNTRTRHAPANLATCRNLVIGALRAAGHANIAHARTIQANRHDRALTLFDL
jgi:predicted transposase YbfD/YdcC